VPQALCLGGKIIATGDLARSLAGPEISVQGHT
jgi:hypothetical protein